MALLPNALYWGPKANIYDFELFKKYVEYQDKMMGGGGLLGELKTALKQKFFDRHMGSKFHNMYPSLCNNQSLDSNKMVELYLTQYAF